MHSLKNIIVGFVVSFVGSIPLGYLNIVGFDLFSKFGLKSTMLYLLGIIFVEAFIVYFSLMFANRLLAKKKLLKFIEGFSVLFMFFLAFLFYWNAMNKTAEQSVLRNYIDYAPFIIGLLLNCFNFIQVPFWLSLNLYLINEKHIVTTKHKIFFYVFGVVSGTFLGMLALILSLHYLSTSIDSFKWVLLQILIPSAFFLLGLYQLGKFYKKYFYTN